jgi:hypothetical protein
MGASTSHKPMGLRGLLQAWLYLEGKEKRNGDFPPFLETNSMIKFLLGNGHFLPNTFKFIFICRHTIERYMISIL